MEKIILSQKKYLKWLEKIFFLIIIQNNIITIGNLKNELIFIPKYIFNYRSLLILDSEKKFLNSYSIKDYI